jgi:hypothetical protein
MSARRFFQFEKHAAALLVLTMLALLFFIFYPYG